MKTLIHFLSKGAIALPKRSVGKLTIPQVLAAILCAAFSVKAELIQHLDATVSSSVSGNPVMQWSDQSGKGNHALKKTGDVYYPSTSLSASGLAGLDFGTNGHNLELFSAAESDSWLDQRSGSGFCVLVAFKVDGLITNNYTDVLGNSSGVTAGLILRYSSSGGMLAYLGGASAGSSVSIANGDTIVYALNYNASLGSFEFWNSKAYDSDIGEVLPADFSLGNAVALGFTTSSGRFLNGMVGEVKIYDAALGAEAFRVEREALAEKWANIANMSEINWRVIPEDPDYPTDDVIMAAISVTDTNLNNKLPANPANTDCTATFQEAIDTVSQANGGTVWVPAGEYRFDHNLILRGGVSIRGRWDRPSATNWNTGSVLKIYHGQGNPDGDAFITLLGGGNATLKELTFWHPNQSPTNIQPYPYVISAYTGLTTLENLTFVNAYRGINQLEAGFGLIRGIYGTTLETGLMSDSGQAVPRFESLYAGPQYWEWWPLDSAVANPGQAGNYANFMLNSGIFFKIGRMDTFSLFNADISGYAVGMNMIRGSQGDPNRGQASNVNIHDCKIALQANTGSFSSCLKSSFSGTQYAIYTPATNLSVSIPLTECNISGGINSIYIPAGSYKANVEAKRCEINGTARADDGGLGLKASNFTSPGPHVSVTSGFNGGVVWGCTYNGTQPVTISGAQYLNVDPTPLICKPLPAYGLNPLTDWNTVRKPAKTNLFNVVAYGAKGDGKTDDTVAVKAAINAAKLNGGGIVFFPFGEFGRYRITDNLDLGAGVELRGIGQRGPVGDHKAQSIIVVEKSGPADGTTFITMGDGSGVRGGLVFFYPSNNWDRIVNQKDVIPYPFTIRATGTNNYIIACTSPNPYQFAEFKGAKNPLADMILLGSLRTTFHVSGGTTGCRIMTGHVKPSGTWGGILPDITPNTPNQLLFVAEVTKTLEIFDLDDCDDITISGVFAREAHKMLTCDGAQGRIIGCGGEAGQGGLFFERAGETPFDLIDLKPNMSEYGDETGKSDLVLEPTFQGSLDLYNGINMGPGDYAYKLLSGNLYVHSRKFSTTQVKEIYVGANAKLTLYDEEIGLPWTVNVESNALLKLDHCDLSGGIPYARIEGEFVMDHCLVSKNCILSVPGQTQFTQHGLILDRSNTVRVKKPWDWKEQLVTGNSFRFDVTEPAFQSGKVSNINFNISIYIGSTAGGSNRVVKVYYDSTSGEKLGYIKTYTSDVVGDTKHPWGLSFSVTDARFSSSTNDLRIEITDPENPGTPAEAGLEYVSVSGDPALEPPFALAAAAGAGSIAIDWKGKSHWKFGSYSVYRSATVGGPYTKIATNVTTTAFTDANVIFGSTYYYIVKTVDSSGNESTASSAVSGSLLVNPRPGTLQATVSGNTLALSWPTNLGWILQRQTNTLNVGLVAHTNAWFSLPGSELVTTTNLPMDKANPTVFYRLIYP